MGLSIRPARNLLSRQQLMNASFDPLHLVNTYGAFGSVTRERHEVVLEGTDRRATARRRLARVRVQGQARRLAPAAARSRRTTCRLDWLMWFAALSPRVRRGLVRPVVDQLLDGNRPDLGLLRQSVSGRAAGWFVPGCIATGLRLARATHTGAWWVRELVSDYLPPVRLETAH